MEERENRTRLTKNKSGTSNPVHLRTSSGDALADRGDSSNLKRYNQQAKTVREDVSQFNTE